MKVPTCEFVSRLSVEDGNETREGQNVGVSQRSDKKNMDKGTLYFHTFFYSDTQGLSCGFEVRDPSKKLDPLLFWERDKRLGNVPGEASICHKKGEVLTLLF